MMKVLLHGATNCGSSNFGDYIYGEAVYQYIKEQCLDCEIQFYQPSDYFKRYIKGYQETSITLRDTDLIVYIPGGYFGQGHKARFIDNIIHFLRFMPLGLMGALLQKRIAIIGVGAGPITSLFFKIPISIIVKNSEVVTVRDYESLGALNQLQLNNVVETSDMILAMDLSTWKQETDQLRKIDVVAEGKKKLFVHYNHSSEALSKFSDAVNKFLKEHKDYQVIVGSDCILEKDSQMFAEFESNISEKCFHFVYDSPYELVGLLSKVDVVLTCKLHVGVVAAMFEKSVISIAEHPEKTLRFYRQIGESQRCVSLYDTTSDTIQQMLNEFSEIPVRIPVSEIEKASQNYEVLRKFISG